jgi:hypothetical protein
MTHETESMRSAHRQTAELLPWYVTGSLAEAESDYVENHLRECLNCRVALRAERRLLKLVREQDDFRLSHEHGVADLLTRIEGRSGSPRRPALMRRPRLALGMACLAAIVVVGAIVGPTLLENRAGIEPGAYETLTDPPNASANYVDVVFEENQDSAALDRLLQEFNAELVGGPTALGRYTIAVPDRSTAEIDDLIRELGAEPAVRFAGRNLIDPNDQGPDPR